MKAAIIGTTGLIGGHLLRLLSVDEYYEKVNSISRRPMDIGHSRIKNYTINFDAMGNYKDAFNVDVVFCTLGTTIKKAGSQEEFRKVDYEYVLESAKISKEMGVSKFLVVTALGSDANSMIFYNKVKGEIENALSSLSLPYLGVFQPSLLLGERGEVRTGEKVGEIFMGALSFVFIGPLKKYKAIKAETVARSMIKISKMDKKGIEFIESDKIEEISKESINF
ncbi:MAG: oxidoreductase [Leptospiraceae bacterium]|nr:oxidoreductase [Leptospiraceae bacterium]